MQDPFLLKEPKCEGYKMDKTLTQRIRSVKEEYRILSSQYRQDIIYSSRKMKTGDNMKEGKKKETIPPHYNLCTSQYSLPWGMGVKLWVTRKEDWDERRLCSGK